MLVRFKSPSVAESGAENPADQVMRREQIRLEQNTFVDRIQRVAPGARVIAEVQGVLNAVVLQADAAAIKQIAADPAVARVSRVIDYKLDLAETVPYITARRLQHQFKGTDVRVAVPRQRHRLHAQGVRRTRHPAAYEAAYGTSPTDPRNTTRDGLFPTAKVSAATTSSARCGSVARSPTTSRPLAARAPYPMTGATALTSLTSSRARRRRPRSSCTP